MNTARYPHILRTFVSTLVILLTGAVHSQAGVIVGTSLDLTGTIYTGPLNTVQFVPVGSPQAVGGNVYWNNTVYAPIATNGAFAVQLQQGFYYASPVNPSVFGPAIRKILIYNPDGSTNTYSFGVCANLALVLSGYLQTNVPPVADASQFTNGNASTLFSSGVISSQFLPGGAGGNANVASNLVSGVLITNATQIGGTAVLTSATITNLTSGNITTTSLVASVAVTAPNFVATGSPGYTGNGSQLAALVAGNITPGGTLPALNGAGLTSLTGANVTGLVPAALDAGIATNLVANSTATNFTVNGNFTNSNASVPAQFSDGINLTGGTATGSGAGLNPITGGNVTGQVPSAIDATIATNLVTGSTATNLATINITNSGAASFATGATNYSAIAAIQSPQFVGGGAALTGLTGANVTGLVPAALDAGVATNLVSGSVATNLTTTAGSTINGNGAGLTNVAGSSIQQQSTNTVYYFDPYATNAISQPNNPLAPYHYFDQINTAALTPPTLFDIAPGIYYFSNSITNVSVAGHDEYKTVLVDTITNTSPIQEQIASAFTVSVGNLTWHDFTVGFTSGGPNNQTNYSAVWDSMGAVTQYTNEYAYNINYPLYLPNAIPGGSSFDGLYDNCGTNVQWTFNNVTMDVPWDCYVRIPGTVLTPAYMRWINCNSTTECITNASNPSGLGRFWYDDVTGNGSTMQWVGCTMLSKGPTNGFVIEVTGALSTNINMQLTGCTIKTVNNYSDFYLQGKTGVTNNLLNISGCILDSTNIILPASTASWINNASYSYQDWSGVFHSSGITSIGGGIQTAIGAAVHIPSAVTVGASVFTFINPNPNAIEVYLTDSAAYSVTKNGVSVFNSLSGDAYLILQPTNAIAITYSSTTPTMSTNAW